MSEKENTEVVKEKSYDWLDDVIEESGMLNTFHKLDILRSNGIQYNDDHMICAHRDLYDLKTDYKPITEFEDHELEKIASDILSEVGSLYVEDDSLMTIIRLKLYYKIAKVFGYVLNKLKPTKRERKMFLSPPEKGWSKI